MPEIVREFILDAEVSYWNVDRDNVLSLRSLFTFLQEAAIRHADQCGAGARAMEAHGESWVLHRMDVAVARYPHYEEPFKVVTWSTGVRGFKGFRDFRCYSGDELVAQGSSIWLYFTMATKSLCRVPKDVADGFPSKPDEVFSPSLERIRLEPPAPGAAETRVSVRYSDYDGNRHVNNTAYLDFLQTALAAGGHSVRPASVKVQFLREIPLGIGEVSVALEQRGPALAFGLGGPSGLYATGSLE